MPSPATPGPPSRRTPARCRSSGAPAHLAQQRREELERARRPAKARWLSLEAVDASQATTYGIGSQYVYAYTFPRDIENARLKNATRYSIKVGMTINHPVQRVHEQVAASRTAMSQRGVLLLVFQTHDGRYLEKWLHGKLERTPDSVGSEWFTTSPAELISLFHAYLDHNFVPARQAAAVE